jgi:hypothetical protein
MGQIMTSNVAPRTYTKRETEMTTHENHLAYLEAIQHLLRIKAGLYSLVLPKITIISPSTVAEYRYEFTTEQQKTLDLLDEAIAFEASKLRATDTALR